MPKFASGCPGQDIGYLKDFNTHVIPCPKCGHEIEFFSDERKVKCKKCHASVFRIDPEVIEYRDGELIFSGSSKNCLGWCGHCLDHGDYKEIKEHKARIEKKNKDFRQLIGSIDKKDKEVIDFFIEAFKKSINGKKLIDEKIFNMLQEEKPKLFSKARNYYINFIKQL